MLGFFTGPSLVWGPGALEQLSALGAREALVVVDPNVHRREGELRVVEELRKTETSVTVYADVEVEPTVASVERAAAATRGVGADWIVAVGGGSTLDTAKALWIRRARPDLAWSAITPLVELGLRRTARFAALPTTSGSGSEATWTAHLRGDDGNLLEVASRELVPDWAILDPQLVAPLPPAETATTGADALAHALEAVASAWAGPFSDAAARYAVGRLVAMLPRVVRHGDDLVARAEVQAAASLAGLAVSNSSYGVVHALAHALGAALGRPHARLVAAFLPFGLEFNFPSARDRYEPLAPALGAASLQSRGALGERMRELARSLGLPTSLSEAGIDPGVLAPVRERVIAAAHRSPGAMANPRVPSVEELGRLLDAAVAGTPVAF